MKIELQELILAQKIDNKIDKRIKELYEIESKLRAKTGMSSLIKEDDDIDYISICGDDVIVHSSSTWNYGGNSESKTHVPFSYLTMTDEQWEVIVKKKIEKHSKQREAEEFKEQEKIKNNELKLLESLKQKYKE